MRACKCVHVRVRPCVRVNVHVCTCICARACVCGCMLVRACVRACRYALWLDSDLSFGSSRRSQTFLNTPLHGSADNDGIFRIVGIEVHSVL